MWPKVMGNIEAGILGMVAAILLRQACRLWFWNDSRSHLTSFGIANHPASEFGIINSAGACAYGHRYTVL